MSYLLNGTILLAGDTMAISRGKARCFIIGMDKKRQEESIGSIRLSGPTAGFKPGRLGRWMPRSAGPSPI